MDSNKKVFEADDVMPDYIDSKNLQMPEAVIFAKFCGEFADKAVLDLGCGGGRLYLFFRNITKLYTGLDGSEGLIKYCRKAYPFGQFHHEDMRNLGNFPERSFDSVVCAFNSLDLIGHEDRLRVLREIFRILKPGGLFVFSAHNRNYKHARMRPRLQLCLNPVTFLKNILLYLMQLLRRKRFSGMEMENREYCLINDRAHDYRLLTYYIDKAKQAEQIERSGFRLLEMRATDGAPVALGGDDADSCWIYYTVRKP